MYMDGQVTWWDRSTAGHAIESGLSDLGRRSTTEKAAEGNGWWARGMDALGYLPRIFEVR